MFSLQITCLIWAPPNSDNRHIPMQEISEKGQSVFTKMCTSYKRDWLTHQLTQLSKLVAHWKIAIFWNIDVWFLDNNLFLPLCSNKMFIFHLINKNHFKQITPLIKTLPNIPSLGLTVSQTACVHYSILTLTFIFDFKCCNGTD